MHEKNFSDHRGEPTNSTWYRFNSRLDHCPKLTPRGFKNHSFLFCFRCTSSLSDHLDSMNDKLTALEIDRVADHLR